MSSAAPTVFGVLSRLGYDVVESFDRRTGGFGLVYKVRQRSSGRIYAAKTLKEVHLQETRVVEAFYNEAVQCLCLKPGPHDYRAAEQGDEILAGFHYVCLVESLERDKVTGASFLILEYIDGESLADLRDHQGQLEPQRVRDLALQFCRGMRYIAFKRPGFVHRDIKPSNAMITRADGTLKIIDLGISTSVGCQSGVTILSPFTPGYASPEQRICGGPLDVRSDIYSFGVTLLELLTGIATRRDDDAASLRERVIEADLAPGWSLLLCRCLAPEPAGRFRSFDDLEQRLLELSDHGPGVSTDSYRLVTAGPFSAGCGRDMAEELVAAAKANHGYVELLAMHGPLVATITRPFRIAVHAVTNADYAQFVRTCEWSRPPHWKPTGQPPYPKGFDQHPVTNVTWYDAAAYCRWKGLRLPTDAEWERAARGTDGRAYPWGPGFDTSRCNSEEAGFACTVAVAEYGGGRSPEGLYQVAGNVWEWTNPSHIHSQAGLRGGCFRDACELAGLTFAGLLSGNVEIRDGTVGFRVAMRGRPGDRRPVVRLRDTELLLIAGGPFLTGCPKAQEHRIGQLAAAFGFDPGDFLNHHVAAERYADSFFIGRYPVTNHEYLRFVRETGQPAPPHWHMDRPSPFPSGLERFPVVNVSPREAEAFCAWLGPDVRLPWALEWEKAARGTDGRLYPWGDEYRTDRCNGSEGGQNALASVDDYPDGASPYGVRDLVGNVREWVINQMHLHGGSFQHEGAVFGTTFLIMEAEPDLRRRDIGFRCVLDPTDPLILSEKTIV